MDDKFKKALNRLQSIAKEEGWEKPASNGTSGTNRPSKAAEIERGRLLSTPRYTAARERFGKEATSKDYFDQNYRKVLAGGTNEEKRAFRDTYQSFLATEAYDRELADLHKRMQDTIRSGGFDSADEAVHFIFNNADGTSRTPHLDKMEVEPLHEISFDKEALEQSIRLQWDTKWAEDNAAKNEAALGLAVNAEKIAQVNARGSLIDESTIPGAGVMASKQNLYATPPADIYSEGRLWAGAKSGNDAVMRTDTDGTAKRTQEGYKPAPGVEALTPEALSETPVKSLSMTKEELYAGIDEALYNNDYRTACQYQFQLIEGAVKQSGDEYIQDMVHSEGSQKATAALMQMAIAGDLPRKMMDPDVRVELAEYEMLLKEAYDIGDEELGGFIDWLDGVLGMDGKLVEAQSNDGIGVSNVAMWALDHTAYAITDLVDKFVGSIITGAGKLFGNEEVADYGAEFANEMNTTLAGHNEVLMENGTPLEIMAGIAGSEMIKMQQLGKVAGALGNASAAVFGDKLKFLVRMISSTPFAAESGLREMWDSYNEGEDYLTSAAAGLGAAAVTAAMSQWDGILKNIEASNMPYVEEVVEKLALVPGSGVVAGLSRWGKMFGHFMVNIGKTAVNEAVQEPAENIVTEAVTGLIKGENPLERDWQEYGRELTADALMGGLISIGSSVSVFPSYANSVKVAESLMKKSAITAEDANTLVNAVAQDLQDPTIAEAVRERATKVVTEAKAGEMMASGAIDGSSVEAAKKSVSKAAERFESAQRKNELAKQKLADATRRMNENPADPKATNEVLAVIEEKNQAQEEMVTAQREAQEAQGEYEAAKANVQETALAMAQTELAAVANQNAIVKAERAAVRSAARESGNVTAMGIADFTSSNFADATPEEQQRIDAIYREIQREMTPEAQESRNRFMQQLTKKYGVQFDVVDTTKGGTALRYNGSYNAKTGRVEIDQNATQSDMLYGTVLHELTHRMEQSESYQEFADALIGIAYSGSDEGQLDRDIAARMKRYNTQLEMMAALDPTVDATPLTEDEARREIVADLTRKILYGDEESINRLAAEKPSVARRILETIKNFISKLTGIAREDYSELDRARELFETALGAENKPREFPTDGIQYSLREEPDPVRTIKGYKVFAVFKNKPGLYPPMVANPGGEPTPVGVWLNADAAPRGADSKTGRPQVQAGGKGTNTGKTQLAYRPGWHLGDSPKATQFNRLNPETGKKELFPENFVWAECECAADRDYQEEAMSYGYNANGKFQHSLAGLPRLPREEDGTAGYYRYRTNPNPDTVPWIITGAMKVTRILDDADTDAILLQQLEEVMASEEYQNASETEKAKIREAYTPIPRKGGAIDLSEYGLEAGDVTGERLQYSLPDLLDPNEYARLRSNMNDKNYRGYQFVERKNGGSLVAMDNVLVYTDANGEPEAVLDVYDAGNVELVNAIEQDAIELEQEGYDLETQRSILHSVYGEESTDFREGGKRNETSGENGAGAGRNARGIRQGDRGEVSAENREITSDGNVIAEETPSGTVAKDYSLSSWTEKEKATARQQLLGKGFDAMKVERWIDDVNSVAATIAADKDRLDYIAADNQVMLKQNQEYVKTLDASTLCAKRLLYQGTFDAIQHLLPNTVLTSDDLIGLRNMLAESGYESPCGVCYVESRRRQLGKFAGEWLEGYNGEYKPRLDEVTTSDGLEKLRHEHPKAYQDFIDNMNSKGSNNPKVVQLRTEYRGDVRGLTKGQIKKITEIGGLRVQSFSDFETPHLIDMMQAVLDMSAKGLTSQAYTKVPNFAAVFGDTGIKINLSLIAEGNGLNPDGTLAFSPTEGMDIADALALRDRYSKNVGTIIVGVSREHVLAAMKDPQIDYIIPFHKSGWGERELKLMGLDEYENFTDWQNERRVVGQYKNGKFKYKNVEENFYPIDYWDYSKSGDENARTYLRMCEEDGRIPKFDMFLVKDEDGHWVAPEGYWKTLIDFKMYDNDGVGAPQEAVQPNFNMEEAMRVLGEYKGGANTLPVAQDIVERFVREYKEQHPRTQYSLPSEDVLRDMIRQYMQLSAMGPEQQVQRPMGERQFARQSVQQSEAMPDWLKQEMYQNPEELNYEIDTNMEQAERGYNRIVQNGFEQERDRLLGLERFSADDTAEANVIMAIANHNGDAETLLAIASKYNREGTKAGQELQARKLFSKMSPTGAKAMVAGSLENTLQEELRLHAPKKKSMDSAAEQVRSKLLGLPEPEQASYDSRYSVELNGYQRALIDQYKLGKERRPGINYNRATVKQRMLEAILATPYPMNEMNGLTLVQRLEYMNEGLAVVTTADLDYIGAQLGLFVGAGAESGGRDADLAIARAYEAFGNITPVSGREKLRTWRYMSMLGTLTSPMRNVIGNVAQNTMNAVSHGIAVGLDTVIGAASGQRTVASLNMKERADGWKAFAQETKDTFRDFFVDKAEVQNRQGDKYNTRREGRVYQSNALETFRNVESFLMSFGDRNFWKKAYVNSLSEQQKLLDRGLLRNEDGTTPTYDQMVERAENDANFATFTEDNAVRDALSAMKRIPGIGDALDYIMPFTGVPTNIVKRMWQYSPMGLAQTAIQHGMRAVRGETFEQQRFVEGMARGLTGSAMVGLGMMLGSLGVIKMGTQDEDDAKKRGLQTAVGAQYTPYVYNPFNNEYMSLSTFAPAVSPVIMGVAANSIFEDDEDAWNAMMSATTASMDQILDASFMSGLKDVFEGYGSTSENIRDTLIESAVSQNVPALIGQLANAVDPYVRDTKDKNVLMAALKSGLINKLPWIRNELLPEKVDVTGQSVMTKENWRNFIDPFTTTDARDDAVVNELLRLSEATGASDMLPVDALSGTKDTLTSKGNSITLDPFQKETYKKRYGELWYKGGTYADANGREIAVTGVEEVIGSKEYQALSDDEKAKKVKAIVDLAKSVAVAEAFGEGAEGYEAAMETVSTKQKSINKSSIADEVSRGNYKNLGSYVKGLEYAGTKASSIKSTVTSFMKEHYKQASEAQRKEIRRILYQTGLYDDYNFEANWLKK